MVLGKLPMPGRPTILIRVGQGSTALGVGASGRCLDIFTLIYPIKEKHRYHPRIKLKRWKPQFLCQRLRGSVA